MVNRELIRAKVLQLVYAYYQNDKKEITSAEKELIFSLSKAYDLYNYMLSLIVSVTKEAQHRADIFAARARREGLDMPSRKFADNKFAAQLSENKMLRSFIEHQKFVWEDDLDYVRRLLTQIEQSQVYQDYIADADSSYESDRELWRKIYKQLIQENDDIDAILEDKSLYWNDDKEIIDTFVLKTIKRFNVDEGADQELLPQFKSEEDLDFARKLFRAAIKNGDTYRQYISENSQNWEMSRLAYMDVIIMQIAFAEMFTFPQIPLSVTINEYVELAKLYSTGKSGKYINGMIDSIARLLIKKGELLKSADK